MSTPFFPILLHIGTSGIGMTSLFILLGGLASAGLMTVGVLAFARRRSRSYLLVVFALGTLVAKAVVGAAAISQQIPFAQHHMIEHGLDFATAVFLFVAVYLARDGTKPANRRIESSADRTRLSAAPSVEETRD